MNAQIARHTGSASIHPVIVTGTRLRMTARGRRVLAAIIAAPVALALGWVALGASSAVADTETSAADRVTFETVTVGEGDSLWAIAAEVAPNEDPRDVVDKIAELNQLGSSLVDVGDVLAIPTEYSDASGK